MPRGSPALTASICQDNSILDASPVEPLAQDHISPELHLMEDWFSPFVRFLISFISKLLLSLFSLPILFSIGHRMTPSASTRIAYLYIALSPGPGKEHCRTHAIEPLFSLFLFPCYRLETRYARYDSPRALPAFGNAASFPLTFFLAPWPSPRECEPASDLTFPRTH